MSYRDREPDTSNLLLVGAGRVVLGLDAATGNERWRTESICGITERVNVVRVEGDLVLAAAAANLVALDRRTGTIHWKVVLEHPVRSVVLTPDAIYACGQGVVCRVSREGEIVWTNGLSGLGMQGPAIAIGDGFADFYFG